MRAVFAVALVLESTLDRRDRAIVASLLRRAGMLANLRFAAGVIDGCNRAVEGPLDESVIDGIAV